MPLPALLRALPALLIWSAPALASCDGEGLLDDLTPQEATVMEAGAAMPYAEGLLWRATRGAEEVLFVGTIHLDHPRLAEVMARVRPLLTEVEGVLLEATREEVARIQALPVEDPERLFVLDGPTLVERLSPGDWEAVTAAAGSLGIPDVMVAQFRPFWLLLTLSMPPCAMEAILAGRPGLDQRIEAEAEERGLPVAALESYETAIEVFEGIPEEDALALAVSTALVPELAERSTAALLDLYFAGRTGEAIALMEVTTDRLPDLSDAQRAVQLDWIEQVLLRDRNRAWIPVIEEAAADGPVLVAVGAAHLPGEDGVLALLAREGWTVERIDP